MKKTLELIIAWGVFLGTMGLMLNSVDKDPETFIQVKILKSELDKARQSCNNRITDVIVSDSKHQFKHLPCSDILTELK